MSVETIGDRLAVSDAQRRLWFIDRLLGPSATYNIPLSVRLEGELDAAALQGALADVVARHESLRTVFPEQGGVPFQQVLPVAEARPALVTEEVTESALAARLAAAAATPMDLSCEIPLRAWLFRVERQRHVLLVVLHHIAADGWSQGPLWRDLARAYFARCRGAAPAWEELPVQYADYTLWQRRLLGEEETPGSGLARQLAFWRTALAGAPEELNLPTDRPRPPAASYRGGTVPVRIDAGLHRRLLELARATGASLFMVLQAGLAALLRRLGAGEDIPIGSPIAGRGEQALEDLVGFFVNTLVLRTDVSGDPSFRDLVARVRAFDLEAYEHQDLPFERLVEALQPTRSLARHPLFQVMLVLQNTPEAELSLPGLSVRSEPIANEVAKFDLTLDLVERLEPQREPQGIEGELEYSRDLFERGTAESIAVRLVRLLEAAMATPDAPLHRLEILDAGERETLLERFNATAHPLPEATLPELFEAQATLTPEAVAVVYGAESVTYAELNLRANRLAHHLIGLGVGPECLVGICVERSLAMAVAVLGALKAGAAFLPLDPEYPEARLGFMMADAGASVLLVHKPTQSTLRKHSARVVCLDTEWDRIARAADRNPERRAQTEHRAYAVYTSGSTGRPKGTLLPHRALANLIRWNVGTLARGRAVLQFASLSFDASVHEMFAAWSSGRALVMIPESWQRDNDKLLAYLSRWGVDTVILPVVVLQQWAEHYETISDFSKHFTDIIATGEQLQITGPIRKLFTHLSGCRLHNHYGPSETHVVTALTLDELPEEWPAHPPIGSPIWNTRAYVLDEWLEPVPVGVAGELYIAGAGLARGYMGRPGLTAERFVADPHNPEPGARMYRTGDLARWRDDGSVEFLGRADQQVKLRGFRIEPAEIEAALTAQPAVAQAAVLARDDGPAGKYLVAYVVAAPGAVPDVAALRRTLGERLPEYMVPSAFVVLRALPLTPNGKLDRKALPAPERRGEAYRAPRTAEERLLCDLFAQILALPRVGIDDHFFELGGHSLLATRLLSRVRTSLGVELAVRTLFEDPTAARLAARLREGEAARAPLVPQLRPKRLPLSYAQNRLWFLNRLEGPSATYNIPLSVRLEGELDAAALQGALADVVARHESLRTVFPEQGGVPFQQVLPVAEARPALVTEEVTESALAARLAAAAATPMDLSCEIPLRAWLFRVERQRHVLLVVLHHIAADGWSQGPLWRDLARAYFARCRGTAPAWGELPVQYADYTLWQRRLLGEEETPGSGLARQLAFWRTALAGAPEELNLPTDRPRPPAASYRGGTVPVRIDAGLHRRLLELARATGASLFMVLQAGLAALLRRLGAGEDIPIGSPIAGRGEQALEDLVGFFVNTLVLRTDVSGDPSFRDLVARVRAFDLEAYEHQDLPFERLVEALQPTRSLARHPLFQVMLVLQNTPEAELSLSGLSVRSEPIANEVAKFDLTLDLVERLGPQREPQGIEGELEYSRDLFERGTAESIAVRLVRLLEAAMATPDAPLHRLEILDAGERETLLERFNATAHPLPEATLPELFEAQAALTPEAVAVVYGAESVTYAELNLRANRLAHHLIGLGAGPECLVGVCLERSVEMVVAMLGVLKAGAAYLPLGPEYPKSQLAFMLRDARAPILCTQQSGESWLVEHDGPTVDMEIDGQAIARQSPESPAAETSPDNLAYVMYTSGSAGRPKGVGVTHRAIVRLLFGTDYARLDASVALLQLSPTSFDASTFELWGALLHGGRCVLFPGRIATANELGLLIGQRGINTLWLTASLFNAVVDEAPLLFSSLKQLLIGGEALSLSHTRRLHEVCPQIQLINGYGPTEGTTFSCCYRIPADLNASWESVPIGPPIRNTRAYVLDEWLEPVPVGVAGELYIAGAGLARGYMGRPGLTAERFVADPHNPEPGARMYRTGDLARWRADGTVEFLGRADQQVKLRGFRIEPAEIEAALTAQPTVAQAAVLARDDGPAGKYLVAYVVAAPGAVPDVAALRRTLGERLPEYMVPSAFVVLRALPLTPNGKLDRKALPAPERRGEAYRAPRTAEERLLCDLFAQILALPRVGIDDHFFELGGHSLLVIRLSNEIAKTFKQNYPLSLIYRYPIVEQAAAVLGQGARSDAAGSGGTATTGVGLRRDPFFCLSYPARLASELKELPIYSLGCYVDDLRDYETIEAIAAVNVERVRAQQREGPYQLSGFCGMALVAFEMARRLHQQGEEVSQLVLIDPPAIGPANHDGISRTSYYAGRLLYHLLQLAKTHPNSWLGYSLPKAATIRRRIFARTMEIANRPDKVHAVTRMEKAIASYTPGVYPGPVTLVVAGERVEDAGAETDFGWSSVSGGALEIRVVPGDHSTIFHEHNVGILASELRDLLV